VKVLALRVLLLSRSSCHAYNWVQRSTTKTLLKIAIHTGSSWKI